MRQVAVEVVAFSCTLSEEEECLLVSASQGMELADGPMVRAGRHYMGVSEMREP